jgi:hypothetical protein
MCEVRGKKTPNLHSFLAIFRNYSFRLFGRKGIHLVLYIAYISSASVWYCYLMYPVYFAFLRFMQYVLYAMDRLVCTLGH